MSSDFAYVILVRCILRCVEIINLQSYRFPPLQTGTDGGRISLALFGRSGATFMSLITLIALFIAGFLGNDSFLLYFLFISFFQGDLEIPMRNEVDGVGFLRAALAVATAAFVVMTLVPVS